MSWFALCEVNTLLKALLAEDLVTPWPTLPAAIFYILFRRWLLYYSTVFTSCFSTTIGDLLLLFMMKLLLLVLSVLSLDWSVLSSYSLDLVGLAIFSTNCWYSFFSTFTILLSSFLNLLFASLSVSMSYFNAWFSYLKLFESLISSFNSLSSLDLSAVIFARKWRRSYSVLSFSAKTVSTNYSVYWSYCPISFWYSSSLSLAR